MDNLYRLHPSYKTPWHKASFDRFLYDRLPALLAERAPLAGYRIIESGPGQVRIQLDISGGTNGEGVFSLEYGPLPACDEEGLLWVDGQPYVVIPTASQEALDQASIACIGEQLYDMVSNKLGTGPTPQVEDMRWDEAVARGLLPLDEWMLGFLRAKAQPLDTTNWFSWHTHLRRILIPNRTRVIAPGQMGRVDPFEVPEGSNIGRVFTVAGGASIDVESGKLVIIDSSPVGTLGPNARMIPFLEHNDPNRLLMGDNMMRQALVPPEPEPALVQTGYEPAGLDPETAANFWCGRNLLTAFIAGGEGSVEDGLILSERAAQRLNYPYPAEAGDKLSNRHGTKGVVSQVLPEAEMPHLPDGTPVEIVFSFSGLIARMNFGQVLEAVMGRVARAEGRPAIVPPFEAPNEAEIRARLAQNGLDEAGMLRLRWGADGPELPLLSTVGWVYWYRLAHLARPKLQVTGPDGPGQMLGELEIEALRAAGALHNALEVLNGQANLEPGAPSPFFSELAGRLRSAGILVSVEEQRLVVRLAEPPDGLRLARPLPHPWLREQRMRVVGSPPDAQDEPLRRAYAALVEANRRLAQWLESQPGLLVQDADPLVERPQSAYLNSLFSQVEKRLAAYLDALLPPLALSMEASQRWSGRGVIAPAIGMTIDQIGLPAEFIAAWFVPLAQQQQRPLEEILAEQWVVAVHQPAISPTTLMAFHPVAVEGPAIRLHPLATRLLNADFDGDQLVVFLPRSEAAQREAGQRLSVAAHLQREPALAADLLHINELGWGLAWLSLGPEQAAETARLLAVEPGELPIPLAQEALQQAGRALVERNGPHAALAVFEQLARRGYAAARDAGASLSPFPAAALDLPPQPTGDDLPEWQAYLENVAEQILAPRNFHDPLLGPQFLSAAVRPRSRRVLPLLLGPRIVYNIEEQPVIIRGNNARGFTPEEMYTLVAGARRGLAQLAQQGEQYLQQGPASGNPAGPPGLDMAPTNLLARARRARHPGMVFARAAASGEVDPLRNEESRLLVGLI